MGALKGRVAIITGAGNGLGRAYAHLFAAEGAKVVVNDIGGSRTGDGSDERPAESVAAEIVAAGGEAIANFEDVADWESGRRLIGAAVDAFGDLHVLVNNAGILRDRMLVNMTEDEWDSVLRVHLKGNFVPTRFAAEYWRSQSKAGEPVRAAIINASSTSGLLGNVGQANYGTAKAGIGAMTIIAAQELSRYGVRVNAVAPAARTRLTETVPGLDAIVQAPADAAHFDIWDPANAAPLVAWLATEHGTVTGRVFFVRGGTISLFEGWRTTLGVDQDERWTIDGLDAAMSKLLP